MPRTRLNNLQISTSSSNDIATDAELSAALVSHCAASNPHSQYLTIQALGTVTKQTLGLDRVDNTSDANKPISAAQATSNTAVQTALAAKQNNLNYIPVNKAGDSMTDSLSLPKAAGKGLLIEGTHGWKDLIGDITPRSSGSLAPLLKNYIGNIRDWSYSASDQGDCRFHVPHDYVPGTDLFIHVHWSHNGTNVSGTLKIDFFVTYAKGHQQAVFPSTVNPTLTVASLNITNTPRHMHRVDEIQMSATGGSATLLDTSQIEVDGMILINYVVTTIPSITGSTYANTPYIFGIDLHYQSNGTSTKNKSPSFYI